MVKKPYRSIPTLEAYQILSKMPRKREMKNFVFHPMDFFENHHGVARVIFLLQEDLLKNISILSRSLFVMTESYCKIAVSFYYENNVPFESSLGQPVKLHIFFKKTLKRRHLDS